ncbi:hypothetical protein EMIT0158MI4_260006 [Burkholderia ambifaria]
MTVTAAFAFAHNLWRPAEVATVLIGTVINRPVSDRCENHPGGGNQSQQGQFITV